MASFDARRILRGQFSPGSGRLIPFVLLLIGGVLLFVNAGNYYLWGDEAVTALYGKNILRFGLPYGFDGRNLHEFGGYYLNRDFLPLLDPWAQFYVAAVSMGIFGVNSFGARALFIVLGLAAMVMQYLFVVEYFKNRRLASLNLLLVATSVTFLLFARQCRYFPLGMFLAPAVAYFYTRYRDRLWEVLLLGLVFAAVFFSNSLIGAACLGGMAVAFFIFDDRRKALRFFLKPLPVTMLLIGAFSLWLYKDGFSGTPSNFKNFQLYDFSRIVWLYLKDYNLTQLLPVGMFVILAGMWVKDGLQVRVAGAPDFRLRKEFAILLWILLFTVSISVLSPQRSGEEYSDIRYAAPVFSMLLLVQALAVERVLQWRKGIGILLLAVAVLTNILTFTTPRSYLHDYIRENLSPFPNPVKIAAVTLQAVTRNDDMILVAPSHMLAPMEFYLGDKLRFCGVVGEDSYNLHTKIDRLPAYTYSSGVTPDWVVLFGLDVGKDHVKKYLDKLKMSEFAQYESTHYGPDLSRPEVFWRTFKPITKFQPEKGLYIFQRIRTGGGSDRKLD